MTYPHLAPTGRPCYGLWKVTGVEQMRCERCGVFREDAEPVPADLVGISEVADLLGVELATVHTWRTRGVMPEPFTLVSDRPAWRLETVLGWAESTGRLEPKRRAGPEGRAPAPTSAD